MARRGFSRTLMLTTFLNGVSLLGVDADSGLFCGDTPITEERFFVEYNGTEQLCTGRCYHFVTLKGSRLDAQLPKAKAVTVHALCTVGYRH